MPFTTDNIDRADEARYDAKHDGRNMVIAYEDMEPVKAVQANSCD